jgi:hypothetical protein
LYFDLPVRYYNIVQGFRRFVFVFCSVADPDSTYHPDADSDSDPDSDFLFDADPNPTFHPDADSVPETDPSFQ